MHPLDSRVRRKRFGTANPNHGERIYFSALADEVGMTSPLKKISPVSYFRQRLSTISGRLGKTALSPDQHIMNDKDKNKNKHGKLNELKKLRRQIVGRIQELRSAETECNRLRDQLEKNREAYNAAFKYARDPILWTDMQTELVVNCNEAAEFFFGRKREEMIGAVRAAFHPRGKAEYHPDRFGISENKTETTENPGRSGFEYEAEVKGRAGKIISVKISASGAEIGGIRIIQETFHNISRYRRSEHSLKKAMTFTESLMDAIPYLIFCKDGNGVYLNCNMAFSKFAGLDKQKIIGRTDREIFPREVETLFRQQEKDVVKKGRPKSGEEWILHPNGKKILLDTLRSVWHGPDGDIIGLLCVSRNVTDSKQVEEAVKQADIINRRNIMEAFKKATKNLMVAQQQLKLKNIRLNDTLGEVEEANEKIMASIRYAKVIQTSLLPNLDGENIYLPDSFVIWMPKDVVGGDIFLKDSFGETEHSPSQSFILAVIDCTGHGVPGAFMTMIASSGLRRIIRDEGCCDPALILKQLNFVVKTSLRQDRKETLSNDGLDAAICFVSSPTPAKAKDGKKMVLKRSLTFAGAKLPLIYVHKGRVHVIKGDRQSIGYKKSDLGFGYTNHTVTIEKEMSFYMFSDGFIDQLGGKRDRRLGSALFKNLLRKNSQKPFEEQREILLGAFHKYKGNNEQQDDVTLLGFGFRS